MSQIEIAGLTAGVTVLLAALAVWMTVNNVFRTMRGNARRRRWRRAVEHSFDFHPAVMPDQRPPSRSWDGDYRYNSG